MKNLVFASRFASRFAFVFALLFALAWSPTALAQDWTTDEMRQEKQAYREFILLRQGTPEAQTARRGVAYLDYLVSISGGDPAILELAEMRQTKLEHRAFVIAGYVGDQVLAGGER